jgi:hypothetical protein
MQTDLELRPLYKPCIFPLSSVDKMVCECIQCTHGVVPGYLLGQTMRRNI